MTDAQQIKPGLLFTRTVSARAYTYRVLQHTQHIGSFWDATCIDIDGGSVLRGTIAFDEREIQDALSKGGAPVTYTSPGPSIDRLLAQQEASTLAFHKLIHRFADDFARLDFPLGSPCPGYDADDIPALMLADWLVRRDPKGLETRAVSIVAADRELEYQTRNDARLLAGE